MRRISSGSIWEATSGYCRAVVANGFIFVSATAATDETGAIVGRGDAYAQTKFILEKLKKVLEEAGASIESVVQTRLYVANIDEWEATCRAHAEMFASAPPALSLVHVKPFIDPNMLVEVELVAALA